MTVPVVVLARPQMGENIGAAARAMRNGGLRTLRLVAPREGSWPSQSATAMGAGALEGMEVSVYPDLPAALSDRQYVYAFTARRRDVAKPTMTPREAVLGVSQGAAFVFGAEREGLTNEEISRAQVLVHIPTSGDFSSLNLAQAVMVMAYEWVYAENTSPDQEREQDLASQEDLENLFARLEEILATQNFFRTAPLRPIMMRNIRAMMMRGLPTTQDVRTWHGIITTLMGRKKTP